MFATFSAGCDDERPGQPPPDLAIPQNACTLALPDACQELVPTGTPLQAGMVDALPQPVKSCFVVRRPGKYVHDYVNIVEGGALYFEDRLGGEIDFRVHSMLVEKGGLLQAGADSCPFGNAGGHLSIGLYGDDPTREGSIPGAQVADKGITCQTNSDPDMPCFPATMQAGTNYYCTVGDSSDPCSSTTPPPADATNGPSGNNFLLEHYHRIAFDGGQFGYKVLAVSYGGSIRLFGDKGTHGAAAVESSDGHCRVPTDAESTLDANEMRAWARLTGSSWTRLDGQTDVGDRTQLTLDRTVDDWHEGDQIVVAPTDWYPGHHEVRTILKVTQLPSEGTNGKTQLEVAHLAYPHVAKIFDTSDIEAQGGKFTDTPRRKAADLRAPVGLLTRSIQIRSLGKTADDDFPAADQCLAGANDPSCYFGGHVVFRQGFRDVQVQGVEFKQLGQGGRMGHYPVHFHLAKSTKYTGGKTFVRDSSVWDSMTRFVTLHGSHDIDVSRNVGYLSVGHGYYGEDATEIDNTFCHNLGVAARAPTTEFFDAQKQQVAAAKAKDPTAVAPAVARFIPPILDGVGQDLATRPTPAFSAMGSDALMPVTFWMMNAHNEQVGNQASGVYGFGGCYWLIGSGISGASRDHQFDGLAAINGTGGQQAQVLRFRGNGCSTAPIALSASREIPPGSLPPGLADEQVGFHAVKNPYLFHTDGSAKPGNELLGEFDRPIVTGNFRPILPGSKQGCANSTLVGDANDQLAKNVDACTVTYLDRFTASFNWTEVNFSSIWLRPWFYVFANGAVTDQLFGGVTIVTAGSWLQVPPAYFSLIHDNLFVGTTQYPGSPLGDSIYAKRSGPILRVHPGDDLQNFQRCFGPKVTCTMPEEGTGFWQGYIQPKRLLNIYDGPAHAEGNTFLNVGAWECDPQPCAGLTQDACRAKLPLVADGSGDREFPCGIYSTTLQPSPAKPASTLSGKDLHRMMVMDAAIGWKQPNGFYYPPAFGHAADIFLAQTPPLPGQTGLTNGLNDCFMPGADPAVVPGDCRHYAIDRTQTYLQGLLNNPLNNPLVRPGFGVTPVSERLPTTPVDFQTVLIDIDGSLTGATGTLGSQANMPTTSVSRNSFFDAPAQNDECLSYGVQTSPYTFVTSVVAKLQSAAGTTPTAIYRGGDAVPPWNMTPMVPIYRQWVLDKDIAPGTPACGDVCDGTEYGCPRASFMMGASIGQASHLTMSIPGDVSQTGALYYIDTNAANQANGCLAAKTAVSYPATFGQNESYVVYNMFARHDSRTTYQLYVGANDLASIKGTFVRVDPHRHVVGQTDFNSYVTLDCDPAAGTGWCANGSYAKVQNGLLTVTLDHSVIAKDFLTKNRASQDRCMPRDLCYFKDDHCEPCTTDPTQCKGSPLFADDQKALTRPAAGTSKSPLAVVCDWATKSSGTVANGATERVFVDCPEGGCLGFAFTLPAGFTPKSYTDVNAPTTGLTSPACFSQADWSANQLSSVMVNGQLKDPLCGAAVPSKPADYCAVP